VIESTIILILIALGLLIVAWRRHDSLVQNWIGPGTGLQGVLIGTAAGVFLPGGPYVVFPLIAVLFQSGAGLGPTLAMITSWAAIALLTVSFELPFMGWRFTVIRLGLGLPVPILVGLVGILLAG
jgi:uncharacterized membrane protein YraQ (UPF0718 family)